MEVLIAIIHVVVALFLIVSILLQSGKGGGVGAAFGGTSTVVFGGHGAGGFLAKVTSVMAITFMITSFTLSYMGSNTKSVLKDVPPIAAEAGAAAAAATMSGSADEASAQKQEEQPAAAATAKDAASEAAASDSAADSVSDASSEVA